MKPSHGIAHAIKYISILCAGFVLSFLALCSCKTDSSDQIAPGSIGHETLQAAFILDASPCYLTSTGDLYSYENGKSQLLKTFPTSIVFACQEMNSLVYLDGSTLSLWSYSGNDFSSLSISDSSESATLFAVAGTYALIKCRSHMLCVNLSNGETNIANVDDCMFLGSTGHIAYIYLQNNSIAALDCAEGTVLYSVDWDKSDVVSAAICSDVLYLVLFDGSIYTSDLQLTNIHRLSLPASVNGTTYKIIAVASDGKQLLIAGHHQNTEISVFSVHPETLVTTCLATNNGHFSVPSTCHIALQGEVYAYVVTTESPCEFICGTFSTIHLKTGREPSPVRPSQGGAIHA